MFVVKDLQDPRLAPYKNLRDKNIIRDHEVFIAEGFEVVDRLINSPWRVQSVLVADTRLERLKPSLKKLEASTPIFVSSIDLMSTLVGFPIHRGVLAAGQRKQPFVPPIPDEGPASILALAGVTNHDNVGAAFRNARALGATAIFIDEKTADPLYRKALRVSMGHVLGIPFQRFPAVHKMVGWLRQKGFYIYGTSPSPPGRSLDEVLAGKPVPQRIALMLGPEGPGLAPDLLVQLDETLKIPMAPDVDSLNAATAGAIALHTLRFRSPQSFISPQKDLT